MKLGAGEVHVWLAFDGEFADQQLQAGASVLEPAERERAAKLRVGHLPRQFLLTRTLQRSVLSVYAPQVAPQAWRFVTHEHGKPKLAPDFEALELHFNLAHTSGLVAIAVARAPLLGVDVENAGTGAAPLHLAPRYFTDEEARELAALPPARQARRFFELWTLKESWLKATGRGLAAGLGNVSFSFIDETTARVAMTQDDAACWRFWQAQPSEQHLLALALRAESAEVEVRMFRQTPGAGFSYQPMPPPRRLDVASGQEQRAQT